MKVLIQRVHHASVTIGDSTVGHIGTGILLFVGIQKHDTLETLTRMADKVLAYRIFPDANHKMNLNVTDVCGGVLAVSQFTLAADTRKGLRPSFSAAAAPTSAKILYETFINELKARHPNIATGKFGADMKVSLTNDGPVTFLLEQ